MREKKDKFAERGKGTSDLFAPSNPVSQSLSKTHGCQDYCVYVNQQLLIGLVTVVCKIMVVWNKYMTCSKYHNLGEIWLYSRLSNPCCLNDSSHLKAPNRSLNHRRHLNDSQMIPQLLVKKYCSKEVYVK